VKRFLKSWTFRALAVLLLLFGGLLLWASRGTLKEWDVTTGRVRTSTLFAGLRWQEQVEDSALTPMLTFDPMTPPRWVPVARNSWGTVYDCWWGFSFGAMRETLRLMEIYNIPLLERQRIVNELMPLVRKGEVAEVTFDGKVVQVTNLQGDVTYQCTLPSK
jgi:hypothetical protein